MENIRKYIQSNKKEFIVVCIISVIALILRLISLFCAGDLWLDEIYSWYFSSKKSVIDVVQSLYNEDLHTPLYFILLHFWMKIFGQNDTVMRLLGFIPAFLTIPLSFYTAKKLFSAKAGYFASAILAVSPFAIYYSTELRFYGFVFFLSLLSSFFFVEYINSVNKNEAASFKKPEIALIITNLALLYTFNISFVFIFFQFLCGIFFIKNKKALLNTYIKAYIITGIFYIPAFIMAAHGIFAYKNSLCSFAQDIFVFRPAFLSIFLQSFFTGNFFYALNNVYGYNTEIIENILKPKQIYLILFPVLFCVAGFFRALFEMFKKNETKDEAKTLFCFFCLL